jgi:hypothetical protein
MKIIRSAFILDGAAQRSAYAFKFATGGSRMTLFPRHESVGEIAEYWHLIDDQVALECKAPDCPSVMLVTNLQHPEFIRPRRDASDMHNAIKKTD